MWMITYCSSLKRTYLTLYCTCHNIIQEKERRRRRWPCPHGRDVQHLVQSATSTMQLPKRYIFLALTCFRMSLFYQKLCHILKGEDGWTIEQSFLRSPPNLLNWCVAGVRHTNLHSLFFFAIGSFFLQLDLLNTVPWFLSLKQIDLQIVAAHQVLEKMPHWN